MKRVGIIAMVMLLAVPYGLYGEDKQFTFKNETNLSLNLYVLSMFGRDDGVDCKGKRQVFTLEPEKLKTITTKCCISGAGYALVKSRRFSRLWGDTTPKCGGTARIIKDSDGYKLVWE